MVPATPVQPWELLGISRGASDTEIRAAFRKLSQRAHPDAGGTGGLYRALVDAPDAMLEGGGCAPDERPGGKATGAREPPAPPQRRPPDDAWLVEDEDYYDAPVDDPPPPRAPSDASGVGRTRGTEPGHPGFLARLARVPSPRSLAGWFRLLVLWLIGGLLIGSAEPSGLRELVSEIALGWLPLLLIAAALARWVVHRRITAPGRLRG